MLLRAAMRYAGIEVGQVAVARDGSRDIARGGEVRRRAKRRTGFQERAGASPPRCCQRRNAKIQSDPIEAAEFRARRREINALASPFERIKRTRGRLDGGLEGKKKRERVHRQSVGRMDGWVTCDGGGGDGDASRASHNACATRVLLIPAAARKLGQRRRRRVPISPASTTPASPSPPPTRATSPRTRLHYLGGSYFAVS